MAAQFEVYGLKSKVGRCGNCGGKGRHRMMYFYFQRVLGLPDADLRILEVGPSKVTTRYLTRPEVLGRSSYTAIDIRRLKHHDSLTAPHAFFEMSADNLNFPDESFDLVICSQVLMYIPNDHLALSELRRVLRPSGQAILTVTVHPGPTRMAKIEQLENPEKYTDEYLAETGTERFYGEDYFERIAERGFQGRILTAPELLTSQECERYGLSVRDQLITARAAPVPSAISPGIRLPTSSKPWSLDL